MDLSDYTTRLRENLIAGAAVGDENTQRAAAALATATENSSRLVLMSALTDLATEINAAVGTDLVQISVDGTDVRLRVRTDDRATGGNQFDRMARDLGDAAKKVADAVSERVAQAGDNNSWGFVWPTPETVGELRKQWRTATSPPEPAPGEPGA
ncbi:hypothetical protein [Nocardia stercoris]|uniref:Uncharacterized protein n=1 Tax=Nocardia stercoris TaxID=2483361 RepID=A0A3M2LBC2_9NOCA|nr:hypothetical protein [Nocardia stercoris]RMI34817.1 hypothetical protein EBN03_00025 [Nocardia stercoris]